MACLRKWKKNCLPQVEHKSDFQILEDISNKGKWYRHEKPHHRMYMRFLKQEAHRRGLGS